MAELGMAFLNPIATAQEMGIRGAKEERDAASEPDRVAHQRALTHLATSEASKMDADTEAERRVSARLAASMGNATPSGEPPPQSKIMYMTANEYLSAGSPAKALAYFKAAGEYEVHEEGIRAAKELERSRRLTEDMKEAQEAASVFDGVKDQAGMDNAIAFFEKSTGHPWKWGTRDYNDAKGTLLPYLSKVAMTSYQRAELAQKKAEEERKERNDANREIREALRDRLAVAKGERETTRLEAVLKGGGKAVPQPTKQKVKDTRDWLAGQPGIKGNEEQFPLDILNDVAESLAQRSNQLYRDRGGAVDPVQARRFAFDEMVKEGEIILPKGTVPRTIKDVPIPFTSKSAPAKFEPPKILDPKVPDSKRKPGVYTSGVKGAAPAYWDGQRWTKPPKREE